MCITTQDCLPVAGSLAMAGKNVYSAFPDLVQIIPPEMAVPGHCLVTGEPMSHQHMYPPGLTPRHMTDEAYYAIITRRNNHQCVMCKRPLHNGKLNMQQREPREMKHHHCDRCWDYHLLLAGVIHNVPEAMAVVRPKQTNSYLTALPYQPAPTSHQATPVRQEPLGIEYQPQFTYEELKAMLGEYTLKMALKEK